MIKPNEVVKNNIVETSKINYEPMDLNQDEIEQKVCKITEFFEKYSFNEEMFGIGTNLKGRNQKPLYVRINDFVEFEFVYHWNVSIQFVTETKSSDWWLPKGAQPLMTIINDEHLMNIKLDEIKKIEVGHRYEHYADEDDDCYEMGFVVYEDCIEF